MAGIALITRTGPKTFKVEESITGGQIVEAGSSGGIVVAKADSSKVLGVAITDAAPHADPVPNQLVRNLPEHTGVAYSGVEVYLETTSKLRFGDKVAADTGGKAKAHTGEGDVVGIVTDPAPTDTSALVRLA